jgi:hypothetical protein
LLSCSDPRRQGSGCALAGRNADRVFINSRGGRMHFVGKAALVPPGGDARPARTLVLLSLPRRRPA